MAKDTFKANFKGTSKAIPVEDYRRKLGHHDKKVVQKDVKHQKHRIENKRNFGKSVKDSWKIVLSVLGVVTLVSLAVYGILLRAPVHAD